MGQKGEEEEEAPAGLPPCTLPKLGVWVKVVGGICTMFHGHFSSGGPGRDLFSG